MTIEKDKTIGTASGCFAARILRQWVFILGPALLLSMLLTGCGSPDPPSEISAETLSIRELYPEALKIAREWKDDAYLVQAQAAFWRNDDEYRRANFSFRSHASDIVGLSIWYDLETDSFSDKWLSIANEDSQRYPEIVDSDWRLDSIEALEIAQAQGGADFLAGRSKKDLNLYIRLEMQKRGDLLSAVWYTAYYDTLGKQNFYVIIDALTGEMIETGGTP